MEPEGIISITLEEETEESVDTSGLLTLEMDEVIGHEIYQVNTPYTLDNALDNARPSTDGEWRVFYGDQRLQTLQPLTRPYEFVPRDLVDRESLESLSHLVLQEDVENPSGLPPNVSEEETETRLVTGGDLSGTIQILNTEWFEFTRNELRRRIREETQAVEPEEESVQVGLSENLETESNWRLLNSVTIQGVDNMIDKRTTTKPIVTPTDNPNIFNVDWGLNKYPLNEFTKQKKSLFNSDDINTIEKHAVISISNKETVNLLESTDNSLMLLREHLPQNIKRDIDNNINVPSLLFGVEPKYVSQFNLEYISEVDLKPHDWEYVKKNVYKRNYGTGDTGHHDLMYFRSVSSDINESKSDRVLRNLLGILGFVKFSGYLSSVSNPEEFAEAADQMGMNEDDIFKKTRGFKELFILKLTEFDFRESSNIRYFSKRPDGVIGLNAKDIWSRNRNKHYQIETVYI